MSTAPQIYSTNLFIHCIISNQAYDLCFICHYSNWSKMKIKLCEFWGPIFQIGPTKKRGLDPFGKNGVDIWKGSELISDAMFNSWKCSGDQVYCMPGKPKSLYQLSGMSPMISSFVPVSSCISLGQLSSSLLKHSHVDT